ncbi:MAG: Uma2 family endonuclease [Candidatus Lokiarchaeota archaeon]|nr:Uma2 family endonuclease [Candidatus Lokiarchaeota archaeon]
MIVVSHAGHEIELPPDSMIIIKFASEHDYESLANEDLKIEFDGECLYIHSPASKLHENVVFNLLTIFKRFLSRNPSLGDPIGSKFALKLPNGKRPEPDVVVVPRGAVGDNDSIYEGIPRLVIEVLSPSTKDHDLNVKRKWYEENRVPEIWYVDLEGHKITALRPVKAGTYKATEYSKDVAICEVLGHLEVSLAEIFST